LGQGAQETVMQAVMQILAVQEVAADVTIGD